MAIATIQNTPRHSGDNPRTYQLLASELKEIPNPEGAHYRQVKRSEIAKIFRKNPPDFILFQSWQNKEDLYGDLETGFVVSSDIIQIGCQRFTGKNAQKLRQWALRKKKTKKK